MAYTPDSYDPETGGGVMGLPPAGNGDWFAQNPPSTGMGNEGGTTVPGRVGTEPAYPAVPVSGAVPTTPNPVASGTQPTQDAASFVRNWFQQNGITPGNETDGTTRKLVDAMKAAGYNVSYEQPDEYGRSSGIILNGVWTKVWDGSGNVIVKPFAEAEPGSPWQQGGAYTGGYGNMFGNSGMGGPFMAPDWGSLKDYPGYQFAFNEGLRGIQNSAAAKGTLLTGGTLKDIGNYLGGSLAGPAYSNYFSQAKQVHDTNFGDLFSLAGLGKPA